MVSNTVGSVTSSNAMLTVFDLPVITTQPANVTINAGLNATFNVTATGKSPLSCQWQFNGVNLPAGTNSSLVVSNAALANAGNYRVIVSNPADRGQQHGRFDDKWQRARYHQTTGRQHEHVGHPLCVQHHGHRHSAFALPVAV